MKVLTRRVLPNQAKDVKADLARLNARLGSKNVLNLGDTGKTVEALQRHLKAAGAYSGKISGTFDEATEAALKSFQTAKKLTATGTLNKATYKALKSVDLFVQSGFAGKTAAHIGQRGSDIKSAEAKLARLGFLDQSEVDGTFDKQTQAAVARYRKADHEVPDKGLYISSNFYKELSSASKNYDHAARRHRDVTSKKGLTQHNHLDTVVANAIKKQKDGSIGEGAEGKSVAWIQKHLEAAGYELGAQNGKFNSRTAAAVRAFQAHSKLPVTGEVNAKTWAKLKGSLFAATTGTSPAQRTGEQSGSVLKTEKLLKKLGYHVGAVDGFYSANTEKAVKAFQKKHHIKTSGKVGSGTLTAIQKAVKKQSGSAALANVVKLARSQLGVRETPMGSNVQKYSRYFGRGAEPWCADFVSWLYTKSGKKLNIPYTPTLLAKLHQNGTYTRNKPKPGYIIMFDWHPGSGVPAEHTGIVEKVYRKNGQLWVQTIEGNNGNMVQRRNIPVSSSLIAGFGTIK